MPCEIHDRADYVEVRVSKGTTRFEVLDTVAELARRDHGKQKCDLWIFSKDVELSYADFAYTAEAIGRLCPPDMKGNRCAIVGGDALQEAQLGLYRDVAASLPFEIRVFGDETAAIRWLKRQDDKPNASTESD
jgi:hypothetical protein